MEPVLSDATFKKIATYLYDTTGITLKDYKKYLVINRLSKYVGSDKTYKTFEAFYQHLVNDKTGELFTIFTNSLTTNFSFFFREPESFEFLKQFLAGRDQKEEYLRLWSAAASTGEEGYSMTITAMHAFPNINQLDFKILGTDISNKVLALASEGVYRADKTYGHLPAKDLERYFTKNGETIQVRDAVKKYIVYRYLNLLEPYPFKRKFDAIFLRNVLIYFDDVKKQRIISAVTEQLKPDGILILGLSESLVGIKHNLKQIKNSIYTRNN